MECVPKHTTENNFLWFCWLKVDGFNGICDLFAMVLGFSVMVEFVFFSRVSSLFLYNAFEVICCWFRSVFITTIYIYIYIQWGKKVFS